MKVLLKKSRVYPRFPLLPEFSTTMYRVFRDYPRFPHTRVFHDCPRFPYPCFLYPVPGIRYQRFPDNQKIVRMHKTCLTSQFLRLSLARFSGEMECLPSPRSKYIKRVHSVKIQRHTDSRANVMTRHQKQLELTLSV